MDKSFSLYPIPSRLSQESCRVEHDVIPSPGSYQLFASVALWLLEYTRKLSTPVALLAELRPEIFAVCPVWENEMSDRHRHGGRPWYYLAMLVLVVHTWASYSNHRFPRRFTVPSIHASR
jgi:hypothetical protein